MPEVPVARFVLGCETAERRQLLAVFALRRGMESQPPPWRLTAAVDPL